MLSPEDQQRAIEGGWGRFNRRRNAKETYGYKRENHRVEVDIAACGAEIEVANFLGIPWVDRPEPDWDGDVGRGNQVRHTDWPNGHLILHPEDRDEHAFYLVTDPFPKLVIRGWILARRGKLQPYWKELQPGRPAYCVPQSALNNHLEHVW